MTAEQAAVLIERLERLPVQVDHLVTGLTPSRLTTPFLSHEWTVAQNVHHLADSHMNAYIRCKLILTEAEPPLKPYDQDTWAALPDAGEAQLATSLNLLQGLHARWGQFFRTLGDADWARAGHHPENGRVTLADQLRLYTDHGLAHIDQMRRTLAAQYPDSPRAKTVLLERIDHEWDAVNRLLVFLAPAQLEAPLAGDWSPKQHMAHLTAWERYLMVNVLDGEPGHAALGDDGASYTHVSMEQANAAIARQAAAASLADVQAEFIAVHAALHLRLEEMGWDDLLQPRSGGGESRSALDHIVANTYEHYLEHWLALPVV
jgi:hypothetical protein